MANITFAGLLLFVAATMLLVSLRLLKLSDKRYFPDLRISIFILLIVSSTVGVVLNTFVAAELLTQALSMSFNVHELEAAKVVGGMIGVVGGVVGSLGMLNVQLIVRLERPLVKYIESISRERTHPLPRF